MQQNRGNVGKIRKSLQKSGKCSKNWENTAKIRKLQQKSGKCSKNRENAAKIGKMQQKSGNFSKNREISYYLISRFLYYLIHGSKTAVTIMRLV